MTGPDPAAEIARWRAAVAEERTSAEPERPVLAARLFLLGHALRSAGRTHEAMVPLDEAVALLRRAPEAPRDRLVTYLTALSRLQEEAGRPDVALATQQEAVAVASRLAHDAPADGLVALSEALGGLAVRHEAVGEVAIGARVAAEEVAVCRELVRTDPAAHLDRLAVALTRHVRLLSRLDRHAEALGPARERVDLERADLARGSAAGDRERGDLPYALYWVARLNGLLGRHDEVLAVSGEAIARYHAAGADRTAFGRSCLALLTLHHADALAAHHRTGEAMTAAGEAVVLLRDLHRDDPAEYRHNFTVALHRLSEYARAAGDRYVATRAEQEARSV